MIWRLQVRFQKWLLPLAVALLLAYTADQLLTGERGIVTWRVIKTQVEGLARENAALKEDIARLERRIAHLKPPPEEVATGRGRRNPNEGTLDADFVDELVRRDLGYIKPGEKVILLGEGKTP